MKRKIQIGIVLLFLGLLFSQILFLIGFSKTKQIQNRVWLTVDEDTINEMEVQRMHYENKRDPISFVVWKQMRNSEVFAEDVNRTQNVIAISSSERIDILFPAAKTFDENDKNTCIVSSRLAMELFGSSDVDNMEIIHDGMKYIIIDVIENNDKLLITYMGGTPEETFSEITLLNQNNESQKQIKSRFEEKVGTNFQIYDFSTLIFLYEIIFIVFLLILLICIIRIIKKALKSRVKKKMSYEFKLEVSLLVIGMIVGIFICKDFFGIPLDLVPTYISDKSFWTNLLIEERENIQILFVKEKLYPEMEWYYGSIFISCGLVLCFLFLMELIRKKCNNYIIEK